MVKKADIPFHLLRTALDIAAESGWDAVGPHAVAERAGVDLVEVYRHYPDRDAFLTGLSRWVDEQMLSRADVEESEAPRDRLFEVMMSRFDALGEMREGVIAVLDGLRRDPAGAARLLPAVERSMRWALEAAGMPPQGLIGRAKVKALGLIYLDLLRTWSRDDSPDLAHTMKAVDKRLNQAEQFANTFERRAPGRRRGGEAGPAPDGEPAEPPSAETDGSAGRASEAGPLG
ncbi:MAG: TetR/AcrR family transcriptional regulator [Azospirillaceae bacterium]